MKTVFETEHIRFVKVTEELVDEYLAMINDIEHVGRFIGRTKTITRQDAAAWVQEKITENAPLFSMLEKESGAFIGNIELMDVNDGVGELGISIRAVMQDKGYGKEAIPAYIEHETKRLGLTRIFLKAYPDNARAIHVYELCGFREYDRTEEDVFMEILVGYNKRP